MLRGEASGGRVPASPVARPRVREFRQVSILAFIVGFLGFLSYVFGAIAENSKPEWGRPIRGKETVICKYPELTVLYGYISAGFHIAATMIGFFSLFYPYRRRWIPRSALFRSTLFLVFFCLSLLTAALAATLLLGTTYAHQRHMRNNVHHNLDNACRTARTGLLGIGAMVSVDSVLCWLISLMLVYNAREDYFNEVETDSEGELERGQDLELLPSRPLRVPLQRMKSAPSRSSSSHSLEDRLIRHYERNGSFFIRSAYRLAQMRSSLSSDNPSTSSSSEGNGRWKLK